jgi:TonB family protein
MKKIALFALLSFGIHANPVMASDQDEVPAAWHTLETEGNCGLAVTATGPNPAHFVMMRKADNSISLIITRADWTLISGEEHQVTLAVNGNSYSGTATAVSDQYGSGYQFFPRLGFDSDLLASPDLIIFRGLTKLARIELNGFERDDSSYHNCLYVQRYGPSVRGTIPPQPLEEEMWAAKILELYPADAIRAELEGRVEIKLRINKSGRVASCAVSRSSGHQILDDAACTQAKKHARFIPARDANGKTAEGYTSTSIVYDLY